MTTPTPAGNVRVLVVEDDPGTRHFVTRALERGGFDVVAVESVPPALLLLRGADRWDALLADINLPGESGFDLVRQTKELRPRMPIALMTADARVDVAVQALRSEVDDFLTKPVAPDVLITTIEQLVARGRRANQYAGQRVLAVGAHPDDVEIGAGGVLLAHRQAGDDIAVLTLSHGGSGGDKAARAAESTAAAAMLGAKLYLDDLEDTRIVESNPTVGVIEAAIADFQPTIVYTHTLNDLHQDHRNVHRATMVAARTVPSLYCYESPSTTVDFRPVRFVAIDPYVERKVEVIGAYASQVMVRTYLEPELVWSTCRYWGRFGGSRFCEPFEVIRDRSNETVNAAQESARA